MSSYSDGDFSLPSPSSAKRRIYPFNGDNESFYTEQEFMQLFANFAPLPMNSPDPDDPQCFLVGETPHVDNGGGVCEWTRIYSRIPVSRNEYETFSYNFPGYVATLGQHLTTPWALPSGTHTEVDDPGRTPKVESVTSRLLSEFFMVGAGGQYETASAIPTVSAQTYVYGSFFGVNAGGDLPDRLLWPSTTIYGYVDGTSPTKEAYKALIAAGSEIVAEDSKLRRWKGNIYERVTRYVKAK